jgi:hypothetical protein
MPWRPPLGGVIGAFAVIARLLFVDKEGAGAFAGLTITANILMSLVIPLDCLAFSNTPQAPVGRSEPIWWWRESSPSQNSERRAQAQRSACASTARRSGLLREDATAMFYGALCDLVSVTPCESPADMGQHEMMLIGFGERRTVVGQGKWFRLPIGKGGFASTPPAEASAPGEINTCEFRPRSGKWRSLHQPPWPN